MYGRWWIACGAVLAAVSVTAGAIGTHYLKEKLHLEEARLVTFETAARYQMFHALGLILAGLLIAYAPSRLISAAACLFLAGTLLFSGGLYAWLLTDIKPLVHVVPAGGLAWIVGWLCLAVGAAGLRD